MRSCGPFQRTLLHTVFLLLPLLTGMAPLFAEQSGESIAGHAANISDEMRSQAGGQLASKSGREIKLLDVPLDYVRSASVSETTLFDFPNKTLVIEFNKPMHVTSTLEGERRGILAVGNHYIPPTCWGVLHRLGADAFKAHICGAVGKPETTTCFLMTGADMENLSVWKEQNHDMIVYALVTAGVQSNAMRASVDEGRFYELGTINVILLTNMKLGSSARTRAIICATEAKAAAMQDLDIRSSVSPGFHQATGTGTDEVMVVEGNGRPVENAGGHTKMGELIARAVYGGVKEAVYRQNSIGTGRSVFSRLQERHLDLYGLLENRDGSGGGRDPRLELERLDDLLSQPCYASYMEAAFALSDAYERGQLANLNSFQLWCRAVAEEIAGRSIKEFHGYVSAPDIPVVVRMSLNALLNGLAAREKK